MKNLLLLHGALGHPQYFDFIKEHLASTYQIHTPIFSGHVSTQMLSPLTMESYVNELEDYIRKHGLQDLTIFGYSMGGYVALSYAARHPNNVNGVMTLATKMEWTPVVGQREAAMLSPEKIQEKVPKFAQQLASYHGEDHWMQLTRAMANMLVELGNHPILTDEVLAQISVPVLMSSGDKDLMVPPMETLKAVQKIPNAWCCIIPDTIHPFEKINQRLFIALLEDFLRKVS